ncbi:hypothetical protein COB21_04320 [Candidatus Aerophobetes bacterium]|uniref:Uncharacterized protein n=1 Tax=Aerophobetes bacterium TaxID=2030807 RepID=A0A2A4X2C5_UNCAE|nr:MAG: hypothetical protein COB21_04320 [Candidatus Aerophobetes bacterium]
MRSITPYRALEESIRHFLTPAKITEIATRSGSNIQATLSPGEYQCLLNVTTTIALDSLRKASNASNLSKETVAPVVKEILSNVCQIDPTLNDLMPQCLQTRIASWLWRTSFLFYKN